MTSKIKKIRKNTKHFFILGGSEDLYFREEVAVAFKPYNKTKHRMHTSITPAFNNDRKDYTSSFYLPSVPFENDEHLEADHRKRVAESLLEISDILVPKPRSKHKYCGVCRGHYEDYKQHTESPEHHGFLKRSVYQCMIGDVCRKYQGKDSRKEQQEAEDTKITEITSEQNPIKIVAESSDISTPQKTSSLKFQ